VVAHDLHVITFFDDQGNPVREITEGRLVVQMTNAITGASVALSIAASRLVKRGVPLKALSYGSVDQALGATVRQRITLQKGIPTDKAREIVKLIKGSKLKVQAAIQGDQLRVSGKNRDDLQGVIRVLKGTDLGIDMQFTNYR